MSNLPVLLVSELDQYIADIKDKSDEWMDRVFINFKNGHSISIIRGEYSYGGRKGLFEIMPSDAGAVGCRIGDEVKGYLTADEVVHNSLILAKLPKVVKELANTKGLSNMPKEITNG